jgi:uncharacterized protein (DUF362 family)
MSRVVVVKYTGNPDNKFLEREQYRIILETGFELLSNGNGYVRFLKRLFPKGAVGMKTNCLARWNPTSLPLVDTLTALLVANAGKDENDIVVWERSNRELKNAGFKLNASSFGRRCLGNDANGVGYDDSRFYSSGKVNSLVTRILTRMVDHSINLGLLKHHSIAGMSSAMKNMYGAVNNPNKYHGNNCSPYAADVNNLEPIRGKHRLTIVDAVRVQYDKGPGFNAGSMGYYNGVIFSEDPVAADAIALKILEKMRMDNGRPPLAETGRKVKYVAEGHKIGLGIGDIDKIDLRVANVNTAGRITSGELF